MTLGMARPTFGAEVQKENRLSMEAELKGGVEMEYFLPVTEERDIETVSANYYYMHRLIGGRHWHFYRGVTLTRSTGNIDRYGYKEESSAWGIGHVWLARRPCWQSEKLRLDFDASGALLLYNDDFPTGGSDYNFMWRVGPRLAYKANDRYTWSLACKWLHVSNGQIWHYKEAEAKKYNPGYNAAGLTIGLNW